MTDLLVVAVDVGATKTLLTVRSVAELASGWGASAPPLRTDSDSDPADLVAWIADAVERSPLRQAGRVAAIGVAAPGPLDARAGVVTRSSNLGWHNVPLAPMLSERLGAPAALEDDANTAALGEWRFGAGHAADPFAYVTVSSGIGSGVIVTGDIVRGSSGNAGEVGHIVIDANGPRCACGRRGDVESFAGGAAMARRARTVWPRRQLPDGGRAPRTASEVFVAARKGDVLARGLVGDAIEALAAAFAALAAVIEPEVIVVGGSIGLGQPGMVRRAANLARKRVLRENARSSRSCRPLLARRASWQARLISPCG